MPNNFRTGNTRGAKLDPQTVLKIRELYAEGYSQRALAEHYDMSINQIGRIVRNESWRHYQHVPTKQDLGHRTAVRQIAQANVPSDEEIAASEQQLAAMLKQNQPTAQPLTDSQRRAQSYGARVTNGPVMPMLELYSEPENQPSDPAVLDKLTTAVQVEQDKQHQGDRLVNELISDSKGDSK